MRKTITIAAIFFGIILNSFPQACPTNGGFEMGNTMNWQCRYGTYGTGTAPNFQTVYTNNTCINTNGMNAPADLNNRHTVMGTGAGDDPISILPLVPRLAPGNLFPSGTNAYSFRIGNNATTPNYQVVGAYAEAEAISITFTVSPQNAGFTYMFACFVQDPGHAQAEQPRFEILIKDENGSITPCGYYKVVAGDTLAKKFYAGSNNYQYTNWTKVGLDLTGQMGKRVTIEFRTSDCFPPTGGTTNLRCVNGACTTTTCAGSCCTTCYSGNPTCTTTGCSGSGTFSPGGHSAYAYVDAYCAPLEIYQPIFCNPAASIQLCAPPGYLGYTWPNQAGLGGIKNTQCVTVTNPVPGTTYTVNLTTVTLCSSVAYVKLDALAVAVNDTSICNGASPFTLKATPSLPGSYTYSWTPSTGLSCTTCQNPTLTATPTSSTTYTVSVYHQTALCGLNKTLTINVTNINAPVTSSTNVSCNGGSNGSATVNPSGGSPLYTYSWSTTPSQTGTTATGLGAGTYTVIVRDTRGCSKQQTVTITQPTSALTSTVVAGGSVSCFGGNNGTAVATAGGGTPSYTYAWLPAGQTTSSISGLSSGTYTVTVTDAKGCTNRQSVIISQPPGSLAVTAGATSNVNCFAGTTGSASATSTGGTPGYTYSWLPGGQTTAGISNLTSGTYTVTVRDAQGCSNQQYVIITQPTAALTTTVTATSNVNCFGGNNGSATVTPTGGTINYTYTWLPGNQTTSTISNLTTGIYTVTVTDAKGCTNRKMVTISQPNAPLSSTITATSNVNCFGGNNGGASMNVSGGTVNYTYSWLPGNQPTSSISNLTSGTYTVTVRDAQGCSDRQTITITQPIMQINATNVIIPASCYKNDGMVTVTATGGTPNYTYQWNPNVSTTNSASGLAVGMYTVTILDKNGCSQKITPSVIQRPGVIAGFTFNPSSGLAPLSVTFTNGSIGGSGYQWNYGDISKNIIQDTVSNPKHFYKDSGTYVIRLISYNQWGCMDTIYATIHVKMKSVLCIPNVFSPNGDGKNDIWRLCQPGIEYLEVNIYDRWGLLIYEWDTPAGGWDGRSTTGKEVPEGTYYYIIKAKGTDQVNYGTTGGHLMLLRK